MKRHWSKEFGPAYFITNTVVEWKNIFIFEPYIKIITNSWQHFQRNRGIIFYSYVIMPSHLHYIVQPTIENYTIVDMQRDFKKFTAKRILDGLNFESDKGRFPIIDLFTQNALTRESAGDLLKLFRMIGKYSRQTHKIWMADEKPMAIHSAKFMNQKTTYIHNNPVKSEHVEEPQQYLYSSARNYYLDDDSLFKITKIEP